MEEEGVEFIRLQFTDMFGTLKNVAVPVSCLEKAMDDRCTIDLASLNGFAKEEETELYLKPDFSTFTILPWRPQNGKVARFLCDVLPQRTWQRIRTEPAADPETGTGKSKKNRAIHWK